jgi:hypothetical protein
VENKSLWAFKIGLFIVALTWFSFTIYQSGKSIYNFYPPVAFTDLPGSIGLGFRTVTSFLAVIVILFSLAKRDMSTSEIVTSFRWLVLLSAAYWVFFLPSSVWGFQFSSIGYPQEFFIIETGLPCLVEGIVMPTVLVVLFFKLSVNKPAPDAIKWGLIAGAANIFVLWFNYTSQWWSEIFLRGIGFLTKYPLYAFEFVITVCGLLLIAVYATVYAKNSSGAETLAGLNLRKAGIIVTAVGLYFDVIMLLWLLFGDAGVLTIWPTFSVLHNVDLWMVTLPLVGLPLIFSKKKSS